MKGGQKTTVNVNKSNGFIKLHRDLINSDLWSDMNAMNVFIRLICYAHHSDNNGSIKLNGKQVYIKRGQLSISRNELATVLNMPPSTIRNVLTRLQRDNRLDIKSDNRTSLITILNYGKYQDREDNQRDNQRDNNGTTTGQPTPISEEVRIKKNKNINTNTKVLVLSDFSEKIVQTPPHVTEKDKDLARMLMTSVYTNYPYLRPKTPEKLTKALVSSSDAINKLHRLDGFDYGTIEAVINWCQQDEFWKRNIQSGSTLRKQFASKLLVNIQGKVEKQRKRVLEL